MLKKSVQIGDKIRISAELLKQIYELPDHRTEIVELLEIREDDGASVLVVRKPDVLTWPQSLHE